jgi:hypothetical protein
MCGIGMVMEMVHRIGGWGEALSETAVQLAGGKYWWKDSQDYQIFYDQPLGKGGFGEVF